MKRVPDEPTWPQGSYARTHVEPKESLARCSVRAEFRADPMLGTAFPSDRLLLVEQPGPWGRQGLTRSHFDAGIAARVIARADRMGIRVLAIRRPGRSVEPALRHWFLVDCRPGRDTLRAGRFYRDTDVLRLLDNVAAHPDGFPAHPISRPFEPLYLVCTHGSHDACCALRGRPIAAAFVQHRPDTTWECSHVGGDRFAANVLTLPSGLLYGSVHLDEVLPLIGATEAGEALPAPLRGKIGMIPEAQTALAQLHRTWGGRVADIRVLSVDRSIPGLARVRLQHDSDGAVRFAEVDVTASPSPVHRLTCQMTTPSTVLIYRPGPVVPVAADGATSSLSA